ncbi:DUF4365 domain-containing protein [Dactylosporangium sp. NPDC005572]|uniref:DUF4365 domain-containing protein n=1 Tax=Dactylosporangium sp. NPDC005572 TaxID=3156889 RepID=UPI0033BB58CF
MIEDASETAFRVLFGSDDWIIRRLTDDYGRDLEVELFEDGHATGILFGVQLKAIDKQPRKGRIGVAGIKASSLNYWRSLAYPVMVAAYSVPADQFFARWAHGYDWHHKSHTAVCTAECTNGPKTVTFNYGQIHRLTSDAIARLPEHLLFFRAAREGDLRNRPMPVHIDGESVDGHALASVEQQVRRLGETTGHVHVVGPDQLAVRLTYSRSTIRAVLPGDMRSATIHLHPGVYADPQGHVSLAADGLATLCQLFIGLKADSRAADLMITIAPHSLVLFLTDFPKVVGPELVEMGREDVVDVLAAEELRRRLLR